MTTPDQVKQFGRKLLGIYTGGVLTQMIDTGQISRTRSTMRGDASMMNNWSMAFWDASLI